jgi:hypothetical protein
MIRFRVYFLAAVLIGPSLSIRGSRRVSEIGLYGPDLRAVRQMAAPTGALNLPAGVESNRARSAWDQISPKGREYLLREPDLALVVVDSNGRWLYRSTGITSLRSVFNAGEALRNSDAKYLAEVLDNTYCRQLRGFYERLLFSSSPYSTSSSRGLGTPEGAIYGSFLAQVDREASTMENREWFLRIVGYAVLGLDDSSRTKLTNDADYGAQIASATASAQATRKQQLDAVGRAFESSSTRRVDIDHLGFHLPRSREDAQTRGTLNDVSVRGRKVLVWSDQDGTVFVLNAKENTTPTVDLTEQDLRSLLLHDSIKVYIATPTDSDVFEVWASKRQRRAA